MRIVFDFTIEDWMAFQSHFVEKAKNYKLTRMVTALMVPLVFTCLIVYDVLLDNIKIVSYLIYMIFSIIWIIYTLKTYKRSYLKKVRKILLNGDNSGILGSHEVIFNDDGVTHIQPQSEEKVLWAGIKKVEENDDYFFLFVTAISALIIPKKKIEKDLNAIVDILDENIISQ